jgi:putative FmdB family regulatory protein
MPIYEYRCQRCERVQEAHRKVAARNRAPKCCGMAAKPIISASYHIMPLFKEYRAIGGDRRYIRTRQEHKDFLRQFNYDEVGNDKSYAPPPDDPVADAAKKAEVAASFEQLKNVPKDIANV